jgi:hypothetical protein
MDSSHIVLRRLELDGRHEPVDAVKAEGQGQRRCAAVHDILLDDLHIHDHDHDQHSVGINAKCNAWHWTVRRSLVERVGTGMYFGGSAGDTPFFRSVIEHNLIGETLGYSLQIKHQLGWPELPGLPGGIGTTVIRHNVFNKTQRGATGRSARPNVLVGHWPLSGSGAHDRYEIYGNVFAENPTGEPLLQAEGRLAIYNNLFLNRHGDAVWIRPHHDRPRSVHFFWNTITTRGNGVRISGVAAEATVLVVGNAVFAGGVPIRSGRHRSTARLRDNVTDRYQRAATYLARPFADPAVLGPRPGQLIGPALDLSDLSVFSGWNADIEGRHRDGTYRGAYHGAAVYPWPMLTLAKPSGLVFPGSPAGRES